MQQLRYIMAPDKQQNPALPPLPLTGAVMSMPGLCGKKKVQRQLNFDAFNGRGNTWQFTTCVSNGRGKREMFHPVSSSV